MIETKSQKDMNKFYQTASNLYNLQNTTPTPLRTPQVPAMRVLASTSKPAQSDDDVRTIIGLALNRK